MSPCPMTRITLQQAPPRNDHVTGEFILTDPGFEGFIEIKTQISEQTQGMNSLPLPERSQSGATKYLSLVKSYPKQYTSVDVNRFVTAVSTAELLEFLYSLIDTSVEIPGSIWDKGSEAVLLQSLVDGNWAGEFVVNQVSVIIFVNCSATMGVNPDAEFLFAFCNGVLSRLPSQFSHLVSQMVPLWIYAILAHSTKREYGRKGLRR
ncbi:hypothetical protein OSTOST_10594 [Ostertagia ostertagi]